MRKDPRPILHGGDHRQNHADPIPGLITFDTDPQTGGYLSVETTGFGGVFDSGIGLSANHYGVQIESAADDTGGGFVQINATGEDSSIELRASGDTNGGITLRAVDGGGGVNLRTSGTEAGGITITDSGTGGGGVAIYSAHGEVAIETDARDIRIGVTGTAGNLGLSTAVGDINVIAGGEVFVTDGESTLLMFPGTGFNLESGHNLELRAYNAVQSSTVIHGIGVAPSMFLYSNTVEPYLPNTGTPNIVQLYVFDDGAGNLQLKAGFGNTGTRVVLATD